MSANTGGGVPEAPRGSAAEQQTTPQAEPTPAERAAAEQEKVAASQLAAEAAAGKDPSEQINDITGGKPPAPEKASEVAVGAAETPLWPEAAMAETLPPAIPTPEQTNIPEEPVIEGGGAKAAPITETPSEATEPELESSATGETGREGVPGSSEQAKLPQTALGGQTAEQYLEATFKEGYTQSSTEAKTEGVGQLEQVRQRMVDQNLEPASWEEVRSFAAKEAGEQTGQAQQSAAGGEAVAPVQPGAAQEAGGPLPAPRPGEVAAESAPASPPPLEPPAPGGMAPPPNPNMPAAAASGVSPEIQAKIDGITNPDGSQNAERAKRQQEYKAAEQKVADLEAKRAAGQPFDQKELDSVQKTIDRVQRDAGFEARADQVKAMPDGDAKTEEQAKLAKEQVAAWKQDSLEADGAYQKAKEVTDKAPKDWETLNEAPKGQEAAYKEYLEAKKAVRRAEKSAEISARERQITEDITLSPEARKAKVAQLEKDRRAARKGDFLEADAKYQKLQGQTAATERALRDTEIGLTDEDLYALGKDGIAGIKDDEKRAKVDRYAKAHAKEFRDYLANRQAMNERESIADIAAAHERYDKGFKDDGSRMEGTDKEITEQKKNAKERKNKDFDPAKGLLWPRRLWYGLNKKIDWLMGKEEMKKSGKQFTDNVKLLVGRYGLKGLIPFYGFFTKNTDISNLQKEAFKGAMGWVGRGIPRLARLFLFLMAGYWLVTPIIAGKVLEMTKPFGGGQ